jgi:cytochrome d ubiquinol oxidase subunit I
MAMWMGPAGLLAVLAGWITTEVGRQPWIVYGVLRTADGASKIGAGPLALSLALFVVAYLFVFGVGIAYVLRLVRKGPQAFDCTRRRRAGRAGDARRRGRCRRTGSRRPRPTKTTWT